MGSLIDVVQNNNNIRVSNPVLDNTPSQNSQASSPISTSVSNTALRDEFVKQHRKNGLVEKFYNFLKNKTNFGIGSKKVEEAIKLNEQGQLSDEETKTQIDKYRASQKNAQQAFGDVVAATTGFAVFSQVDNLIKKQSAMNKVGAESMFKKLIDEILDTGNFKKFEGVIKFFKNMTPAKRIGMAAVGAALTSSWAKDFVLRINRIGSKEFKVDKTDTTKTKEEIKAEKKALRKAKRKETFKNILTGGLYGLLSPVIGIAGGIVGIPAFIAANLGVRYATAKENGQKASFKDFADKLKDNAALNTAAVLVTALPLARKARYNKVLTENLEKVVAKLKDAKLTSPFAHTKTAYDQLHDMVLSAPEIDKILKIADSKSIDETIKKLTNENIFAVKFLQISNRGDDLVRKLKEECPYSRTLDEAKKYVAQTFGERFELTKQLGAGTIAESYLAKDAKTGKEVCIKLIKNGINETKIEQDKQKIVNLIKSNITDQKEQKYLIDNIEELASGIKKEVNLQNEMDAALKLQKYTTQAKVVKPIEVKDNIYVMEKADGISLKTLQDYAALMFNKKSLKLNSDSLSAGFIADEIKRIDEQIAALRAKSPDFADIDLNKDDIRTILKNYIRMYTEQFNAIYKNGKTIHTDIHPGNVFVDLKALKRGDKKVLTLIDTGNTVDMTMQQSYNALKLTQYIQKGNVKDLSAFIMEGAVLPKGMTKEQSVELMEKELRNIFFDSKTKLVQMTNESFNDLASNIMRKHNIIPSYVQASLDRSRKSVQNSTNAMLESFLTSIMPESKDKLKSATVMVAAEMARVGKTYLLEQKMQELKNMSQFSLKQIINNKFNNNMLKTNSEDYLTYTFKQNMKEDFSNLFG